MSIPTIRMDKKVFVFYIIRDRTGQRIPKKVYAFTQDKECRDIFKMLRNMDYFEMEKISTFHEFLEIPGMKELYGKYVLSFRPLITKNEFGNRSEIEVLMTWEEEQAVVLYLDKEMDRLQGLIHFPNIRMFNKPYRRALDTLSYHEIHLWSSMEKGRYELPRNLFEDQFRIFMRLYGYTMMN